jgi:hypothetical protein
VRALAGQTPPTSFRRLLAAVRARAYRVGTMSMRIASPLAVEAFGPVVAIAPMMDYPIGEPDWTTIGLTLALIGSFLLGNAILFRSPRLLIEELFGVRHLRLQAIREYIFHRVQVAVGFTFLLCGFGAQILGRLRPPPAADAPAFPLFWVGAIAILTIALLFAGTWWSGRSFRRYVREYFLTKPPEFEIEMGLARELGELFDVEARDDDTVSSYVERVREKLGLPLVDRGRARRPLAAERPEEIEVEESVS